MYRDHQPSSRNNLGQQSALEAFGLLHSTEPFKGLVCRSVSQSVGVQRNLAALCSCIRYFVVRELLVRPHPPPSSGLLGDYLQSSPNKHPRGDHRQSMELCTRQIGTSVRH